jgi:hypothetical protein
MGYLKRFFKPSEPQYVLAFDPGRNLGYSLTVKETKKITLLDYGTVKTPDKYQRNLDICEYLLNKFFEKVKDDNSNCKPNFTWLFEGVKITDSPTSMMSAKNGNLDLLYRIPAYFAAAYGMIDEFLIINPSDWSGQLKDAGINARVYNYYPELKGKRTSQHCRDSILLGRYFFEGKINPEKYV